MRLSKNLHMALVVVLAIPVTARAAEWSAEPKISLKTGYNDNIRLTSAAHDSVWESALSPSVKLAVATETRGLSGDAGFAIRRFAGGSGRESSDILDREDYYLNTDAFLKNLRGSFKANLDYKRDSTLDSELDQTGNVIEDRATREQLSLGPSWSRIITELTRLELTYQYRNVQYINDPGIPDLVGYEYHVGSASLVHNLTPRLQYTLAAGYNSYQPDTNFKSDTLTLQAGLSSNFTETLLASFLVGERQTTSDTFIGTGVCIGANPGATFPSCTGGIAIPTGSANATIETTSAVFSASLAKTLETGSLSAGLSRSSSPSANGELLDATRLILTGDYRLSETLRSSLKIEYTENETIVSRVGFTPNQAKKTFFRVTPRAAWRWSREWELAGEYQYANYEDVNANKATRNAVYVSLAYRPTRMAISR